MSDAQPSQSTYDPNELRRCIALCFSPKDLRTFAENLGVPNLGPWDRGIQDGAREVVRHFERLGTLDQLVAKLAEARPLTEWPAPRAATVATSFQPVQPAPPLAPLTEVSLAPAATLATKTLESAPAPEAVITSPPTVPSPFAQPPNAPSPQVSPPKPIATTISPPEPILHDPFAPAFPGTRSSAENTKQLEGRKLAPIIGGAVALITIITIGIFLAVRIGKSPDSGTSEVIGGRPLRPEGPARLAADTMRKSLESLARGCDLEVPRGTDVGVWLFPEAYAQCGTRIGLAFPPPGLRVDKPRSTNSPTPSTMDDAVDDVPDVPQANTPRQTNPGRDVAPRPAPAPAPAPAKSPASDGCVDKCANNQKSCNRGCGSEPTSSSAYERWQACQTQCLSTASKCRLACQ